LKPVTRPRSTSLAAAPPRLQSRGPIEAPPAIRAPLHAIPGLRGYKAAAPLKHNMPIPDQVQPGRLRGYKAAAPLKPEAEWRFREPEAASAATKPRPH